VVETGRESTLKDFELVLAGGMNNPGATEVHDQFSRLSPEARGFVRELIVMMVDATVFNTLRAIDEADEISIVAGDDRRDDDLREQADGFADRYLDPAGGWLQRYGEHPRSVFDAWMDEPIDESWLERHPKADR
jgi:hypothetical protein